MDGGFEALEVLTGKVTTKVEVQVEILNPWRYAAIIVARRMTHKTHGTGVDRIRGRLSRDRSSDPELFIHLLTTDNFPPQLCSTEQREIADVLCS